MQRKPAALAAEEFDLVIVGGGIFGAAAAWDAALRGLKTALIDAKDFGGGASAQCFKMVHGGIRYLQHGDLKRLKFSSNERSVLLNIAPHLVNPLPIVIPTYGHGRRGKLILRAGMKIYDALTMDRNRNIADTSREVPRTRALTRSELLELFPDIERQGLTGGAEFCDGQLYSPPRLVLAFVCSAANAGATACNYVEATGFLWDDKRVRGVRARDVLSGETFDIRAKLILNAAGPGAEYLLEHPHFGGWKRGKFSRDAYFIVNRRPASYHGLAITGQSRDRDAFFSRANRHLFIAPWRNVTLIGVWHRQFAQHPDLAQVRSEEIDRWIAELSATYPALELKRDEVVHANCGLVPFGKSQSSSEDLSFGKESRFIDHAKEHRVQGLVTLIGIRYTTGRGDAERALDLLLKQMPKAPQSAPTEAIPLLGGDIDDFAQLRRHAHATRPDWLSESSLDALLRNHGSRYTRLLKQAQQSAREMEPLSGTDTITAEVTHAVTDEMAQHLSDVVLRRTDLGTATHPGYAALERVAERMQALLGWSDRRRAEEMFATDQLLHRHQAFAKARPAVAA
jgi:glycerol-3-phosphate dehydrogenase